MKKVFLFLVLAAAAAAVFAQAYITGCFATVSGLKQFNGKYAYLFGTAKTSGEYIVGMTSEGTACLIHGGRVTLPLFYHTEGGDYSTFDGGEEISAGYYLFITEDGAMKITDEQEPEPLSVLLFSEPLAFNKARVLGQAGIVLSGIELEEVPVIIRPLN